MLFCRCYNLHIYNVKFCPYISIATSTFLVKNFGFENRANARLIGNGKLETRAGFREGGRKNTHVALRVSLD